MATLYSIGHSQRSVERFISLLEPQGIELVVDVRRMPGSRRYPQFNQDELAASLAAAGIGYHHEPDLGGRRTPRDDSPNTFWRNDSFRGYADHMETAEFQDALTRLIELGEQRPTAILCSEALPWRCHRRLIADALVWRGHDVRHIIGDHDAEVHILTPAAHAGESGVLIYDQHTGSNIDLPLFPEGASQ
jgi:uncharacterized protein (DUF488 family)